MSEQAEVIALAKIRFRDLTRWGLRRPDGDEPFNLKGIATAMAFLGECARTKKPNVSSYALKHVAENWGRLAGLEPYVANGEMIVAAVALGFTVERLSEGGINARIGVSKLSLRKIGRLIRGRYGENRRPPQQQQAGPEDVRCVTECQS